MPIVVNLGTRNPVKRLKLLLIDRGLELENLAAATGLSLSLTKKIASGNRAPTERSVARIENFFGVRVFSAPSRYRTARKPRSSDPSSLPGTQRRPFTIPAGCTIEWGTESEAIAAEKEFAGFLERNGATISFIKPTPVWIITEP